MPHPSGTYRVKVYKPKLNQLGKRDNYWRVEITANGNHYTRYPFYRQRSAVKAAANYIRTKDPTLWTTKNSHECS